MTLGNNNFKKAYRKARASKIMVTLFFCFLLFVGYGFVVVASNVIRSSGDSNLTGTWNFENVSMDDLITTSPWVDVRAFGAMGNGADQTTEITNAINSLSGSGGTVYMPKGTYTISSSISVPSGVTIKGGGAFYSGDLGTRITCSSSTNCFIVGNGTALSHSVRFENLKITASGDAVNGIGINLKYVRWSLVNNVNINGFTNGSGLEINGQLPGYSDLPSAQLDIKNIYLSNNLINLFLHGSDTADTSSVDESSFANIRIQQAGLVNSTGIKMIKGLNNIFSNIVIAGPSGTVAGTIAIDISDGDSEDIVYSAKNNLFENFGIEFYEIGIRLDELTHNNFFNDIRIHSESTYTTILDLSGGGNSFEGVTGGDNLGDKTQFPESNNPSNLLVNGEMERWEAGTTIAPSGWILAASAGSNVSRESSIIHKGNYSMALNSTTNALILQDLSNYKFLDGRYITVSAWVYANYTLSSSGVVRLAATSSNETNTSRAYSKPHSGEAGWELLSVKNKMFSNSTIARMELQITGVDTTAYFDQASMVEGVTTPLPGDTPLLDSKRLYNSVTWDPEELADGNGTTKNITVNGAVFGDFVMVSAPYDLQDSTATGYVQAENNVEIRLQNENGGTIDFGNGEWKVMIFKY